MFPRRQVIGLLAILVLVTGFLGACNSKADPPPGQRHQR